MDFVYSSVKNTPEVRFLLNIINERETFQFNNINWSKFIEHVNSHEVVPLIFYRLKKCDKYIPKDIYSYLESEYQLNLINNLKCWGEFLKICDAFKSKNISVLPLKGVDLMVRFYPELHLRSMVDIDILVKEEEFNQAEKILYELNYKKQLLGVREKYWREKQCHVEFEKEPLMVEVHWGLDFKRGRRIILPQLWRRVEEVEIENHKISILSPEDALFSLALHLRRFGKILSLKQVLDVARIINKDTKFNWDYVMQEGRRGSIQTTVYFLLMQSKLFTSAKVPSEVLNGLNIPRWKKKIIEKFILKKTFPSQFSLETMKKIYLRVHFLIYDSLHEPTGYIINIPYEQFCKFYGLIPYTKKANKYYQFWPFSLLILQLFKLSRIRTSRKFYNKTG